MPFLNERALLAVFTQKFQGKLSTVDLSSMDKSPAAGTKQGGLACQNARSFLCFLPSFLASLCSLGEDKGGSEKEEDGRVNVSYRSHHPLP